MGGTRFVGRNLMLRSEFVEENKITLFNRGITNPDLFPLVEHIQGDRKIDKDIKKISTRDWDIVIDISGYWAGALEHQLMAMKGRVDRYIYISTSSPYRFDKKKPHLIVEEEPLVDCTKSQKQSINPKFYNQNKAECERIIQREIDSSFFILRPGLIVGPYDYTDRIYYWLYKVKHQNDILVGNGGENILSYTHVNDLVDLIIAACVATGNQTVFNVSSFEASIKDFIRHACSEIGKDVNLISAPPEFLRNNGVIEWTDLPLYLSGDHVTTDNTKAKSFFGYEFRGIGKTTTELIEYYSLSRNWDSPQTKPRAISTKRESQLIKKLKSTG